MKLLSCALLKVTQYLFLTYDSKRLLAIPLGCAIPRKITDLICAGDSGIAVDLHHSMSCMDVLEQAMVHKDIDG